MSGAARRIVAGLLVTALVAGLVALGVWQLQRRTWKLALIAQVERRLAAAPVAAPGPEDWPRIGRDAAYTRIVARGRYLPGHETLTQAVTDLGAGYWVMTPLVTDRGFVLLVDRGFVPADRAAERAHGGTPAGEVAVTGLLRVSEPRGGFLRANDPGHDRWYSRDVPAIAAKRRLGTVASYFMDADAVSGQGWPRGGLTVVRFPNNHLSYALTWFAMAAGLATAAILLARRGRGERRLASAPEPVLRD